MRAPAGQNKDNDQIILHYLENIDQPSFPLEKQGIRKKYFTTVPE